jgi:hypothetical protein
MRRFFAAFALGLLVALAAAGIGMASPEKAFVRSGWFDQGIRLFRDQGELRTFYGWSAWISHGGVPYSTTYPQAYPPLGVLFIALPRLFTEDFRTYVWLYVLMTSVCYAALAGVTAMLLGDLGRSRSRLLLFVLPAFLYFSLWRFDVLPALLASIALLCAGRGRPAAALILLLLSALAKWYAALFFLPLIMFIGATAKGEAAIAKARSAMIALVAAIAAAVVGLSLLSGFDALAGPVLWHLSRPFEAGAFGTYLVVGLQRIGIAGRGPLFVVSTLFIILQFAAVVPLALRGRIKDVAGLVRGCVFALVPFMMFGHFFSAQWVLWLSPVLALVADRKEIALLALLDLLVFLQFPVLFGISPFAGHYAAVTMAITAVLGALWCLNARRMLRTGAIELRLR